MYGDYEIELEEQEIGTFEDLDNFLSFGQQPNSSGALLQEYSTKEEIITEVVASPEDIISSAYILKLPKVEMELVITADNETLEKYGITNPTSYYILPELIPIPYKTLERFNRKGHLEERANVALQSTYNNTKERQVLVNYLSLEVEK